MIKNYQIGIVIFCLFVTGCAGTSVRIKSAYNPDANDKFKYTIVNNRLVPEKALTIFRERLIQQMKSSGILAVESEGVAKSVEIKFTSYKMRHGASRAMVGAMAGSDRILSTIYIKAKKTNATLAEFEVYSKNPTAMGTSRGLIEDHADLIVQYLKTGKP